MPIIGLYTDMIMLIQPIPEITLADPGDLTTINQAAYYAYHAQKDAHSAAIK